MKKLLALFAALVFCNVANAQSNISLDLKDAPVRTTLEMAFKQAGIKNYVIDSSVYGLVTMTITDQPFENTLKLIMRANTSPLTYTKENDVYIVKLRVVTPQNGNSNPIPEILKPKSDTFAVIKFNHIDPFDLQGVLGNILFINQFGRYNNGFGGGRNF
jgi:hypothetical protein